jgi:dTDP-4-dehydrorhamnose reductase
MTTGRMLIIGADGMLGSDMLRFLPPQYQTLGADIKEVDITSYKSLYDFIAEKKPSVVVNCAAYTDVDGCERNPELAMKVNSEGAGNLAKVCKSLGSLLIHVSTDFVFDGTKNEPYTERDIPNPISKYAESKLAGEREIAQVFENYLILRTTWLFGFNDRSFVRFILKMYEQDGPVPVYSAQRACPTYTLDFIEGMIALLDKGAHGIYNLVNGSHCNRLEFVNEIFDIMQYDKSRIVLMSSAPASWIAKRPGTTILSTAKYTKLTGKNIRTWQTALRDYLRKDTK